MSEATIRPVDVINDLYETDCALDKVTAASSAMYELFFERVYVEHEWNKERHEFMTRMFSVLTDQLCDLRKEFGEALAKYNALYEKAHNTSAPAAPAGNAVEALEALVTSTYGILPPEGKARFCSYMAGFLEREVVQS